jgi:predicted transcriptional regulator
VTTPAPRRPDVPRGVQPERDGRIQCLECGRWYRGLGNHLRNAHEITVDEYKADHGLPASRGLVPQELRETMAANQRRRLQTEPGLREALTNDRATLEARLRAGREVFARTRGREGVRANLRESARVSGQKRSQDIRADKDARARELGYLDLRDLLTQTAHLPAHRIGPMIGESRLQVTKWRGKYGIRGTGREQRGIDRRVAREAGLADVPPGVQPAADGRLRCLDCGRWYTNLAGHVAAHDLAPGGYRDRHGLSVDTSLTGEPRTAPAAPDTTAPVLIPAQRAKLDASRKLANRARAEQTRARHDARARDLGYRDLAHFLTATAGQPRDTVAATFGLSVSRLWHLGAAHTAAQFAAPPARPAPAEPVEPTAPVGGTRMPRTRKSVPGLEIRNIKDEKPKGLSWDEAVDLLVQGYSVENVAERTGFPLPMLAHAARKLG